MKAVGLPLPRLKLSLPAGRISVGSVLLLGGLLFHGKLFGASGAAILDWCCAVRSGLNREGTN
jgi:hypothetical protein